MSPEQIIEAALALPADKREELMAALQQTFEESLDIDDEFFAELERRSAQLKSGAVRGIPHDEVMAEIRKSLK